MDSPRPVLLTKAATERAEARPASLERPITVMKKDEAVVLPNIETAAEAGSRRAPREHNLLPQPQPMSRPCPLLSDSQMVDTAISWLSDGTEFLVVAAVGRQGVGKSTVMSMLAGQAPFCPLKKYPFPVESIQQLLNSEHCTSSIELLVTGQRVLLLDTPPLLSPSLVDMQAQTERKPNSTDGPLETQIELQALQQLAFLYTICHVIIVVQDWFVDADLVRLLQTAEMLKPPAAAAPPDELPTEHRPRLVFVHNRCSLSHFLPLSVKKMQEFYHLAFTGSGLEVSSGIGVSASHVTSGPTRSEVSGSGHVTANLLLLPEFVVTETGVVTDDDVGPLKSPPTGHWGLASLVDTLRAEVFRLPQTALTHQQLSEKHWYHYAARMWENVRKSSFFHEYSRLVS